MMVPEHYYDEPECPFDVGDQTEKIAIKAGSTCAAAVMLYGPKHGAIWDESDSSVTYDLLWTVHERGGRVIHCGTKPLPDPTGEFVTWAREDSTEGERRAWFEFRVGGVTEPVVTE